MGTLRSADSGWLCWFVLVLFYLFYITLLTKTRENNTPPKKKKTQKNNQKKLIVLALPALCAYILNLCVFQYDIHHMSSRPKEDAWNQTALPSYDHQEFEEIFHI